MSVSVSCLVAALLELHQGSDVALVRGRNVQVWSTDMRTMTLAALEPRYQSATVRAGLMSRPVVPGEERLIAVRTVSRHMSSLDARVQVAEASYYEDDDAKDAECNDHVAMLITMHM